MKKLKGEAEAMQAYEVQATRNPRGGWTLVLEGIGVSQVRRLDQAAEEMRSAVVDLTGQDPATVEIHVTPELPEELRASVEEVQRLTAQADELATTAAGKRATLVRELSEHKHWPTRDIAAVVGISHQRVSQLLKG